VVTTRVSVLLVMSSGRGRVAAAGQSVCRHRVSLGATQRLRLAVAESHEPALVVSRLCARPGLAATAPRHVHVLPSHAHNNTLPSLSPCPAI